MAPPLLIAFGGLPATGKTTLARGIAQSLSATYLRIDAIEQALRASGVLAADVGPAGYLIGYALAESNLRLGGTVVADSVNPLAVTRDAWRRAADATGAAFVEIEVICSDAAEHRRRVETRATDLAGLRLPTWQDVIARDYESWDRPHVALDTAGRAISDALDELRTRLNDTVERSGLSANDIRDPHRPHRRA